MSKRTKKDKRPVAKIDFKPYGAAIKAGRTKQKESRNKAADALFISPRYPYYNLNGAFWPHLRILQKKNAMNYLFIAFLTPYSIFSLAVCSCIQ